MRTVAGFSVLLVATLLTACTGSDPATSQPAAASSSGVPSASASAGDHAGHTASDVVTASDWGAAPSSATESALRLEAMLGQHSILVADMMRARVRADADLAQSANAALTGNTQALATLLRPVVGDGASRKFSTLWSEHIRDLFNYASALSAKNTAEQKDAQDELTEYETELALFFVGASHGRLNRQDAIAAVKEHIDHLISGADAYARKDYAKAAQLYRLSYGHTFDLGATLAATILPRSVAQDLATPPVQLRASLTKILGEHVALVIAAMRSAAGDPADFSAMGAALNGNTLNLTGAIDSLFGAKAAKGFQHYWADHVDELMAYTSAAVKSDAAGQRTAQVRLRGFESSFGGFMNTATQNRLGAKALVEAFVSHDRMLLAEVDAYAAKDFQEAQDLSAQTYTSMFTVSGQLSGAIGATLAGKLPKGGSQTGGGGMAGMRGMAAP